MGGYSVVLNEKTGSHDIYHEHDGYSEFIAGTKSPKAAEKLCHHLNRPSNHFSDAFRVKLGKLLTDLDELEKKTGFAQTLAHSVFSGDMLQFVLEYRRELQLEALGYPYKDPFDNLQKGKQGEQLSSD